VRELREQLVFADLADAQTSVADYFDYSHHERLHSCIDYQMYRPPETVSCSPTTTSI